MASVLPTFYCTAIPKRVAGVVVRLLWKRAFPPVVCTAGWPCAVTSHTQRDATTQSPPLYCTMCLCCSPVCAAQSLVLSVGQTPVRPLQARLELSSFAHPLGNPQDTLLPPPPAMLCLVRRGALAVSCGGAVAAASIQMAQPPSCEPAPMRPAPLRVILCENFNHSCRACRLVTCA